MVEVVHHRSNVWKLRGEATVEGTLCASGELLASIVDRERLSAAGYFDSNRSSKYAIELVVVGGAGAVV
jgi:hypothetical protein